MQALTNSRRGVIGACAITLVHAAYFEWKFCTAIVSGANDCDGLFIVRDHA